MSGCDGVTLPPLAISPSPCHETAPDVAARPSSGSSSVGAPVADGLAGSAANESTSSRTLFSVTVPPCPSPVTREVVNRCTGEVTHVVQHGYNCHNYEVYPKECRKKSCPTCGVRGGRRTARAIHLAAPTHYLFLTQAGTTHIEVNGQMRRFSEVVRKVDATYAHVWAAEWNPGGTGAHVHGYYHSDDADEPQFLEALVHARDKAKFGLEASFEPVPPHAGAPYFGYPFKSLADTAAASDFLDLNGPAKRKKYVHSSRAGRTSLSFWRDGAGGRSLTQGEAEALASKRHWVGRHMTTTVDGS
jgi:hypothetical protein